MISFPEFNLKPGNVDSNPFLIQSTNHNKDFKLPGKDSGFENALNTAKMESEIKPYQPVSNEPLEKKEDTSTENKSDIDDKKVEEKETENDLAEDETSKVSNKEEELEEEENEVKEKKTAEKLVFLPENSNLEKKVSTKNDNPDKNSKEKLSNKLEVTKDEIRENDIGKIVSLKEGELTKVSENIETNEDSENIDLIFSKLSRQSKENESNNIKPKSVEVKITENVSSEKILVSELKNKSEELDLSKIQDKFKNKKKQELKTSKDSSEKEIKNKSEEKEDTINIRDLGKNIRVQTTANREVQQPKQVSLDINGKTIEATKVEQSTTATSSGNLNNSESKNQSGNFFSNFLKDAMKFTQKTTQTKTVPKGNNETFLKNLKEIVKSASFNIIENGKNSARIELNPRELGKMTLRVVVENDRLEGKILVETEVAKSHIQSELSQLKNELKDIGLDLQTINIDLESNQNGFEFVGEGKDGKEGVFTSSKSNSQSEEINDSDSEESYTKDPLKMVDIKV